MYIYIYIYIYIHVYTLAHTHTHTHTHTRTHTHIHTYTHTYAHSHTRTHALLLTHLHTHTHAHTQVSVNVAHTYTYTYIHTYIHTHTHAYSHVYYIYFSLQYDCSFYRGRGGLKFFRSSDVEVHVFPAFANFMTLLDTCGKRVSLRVFISFFTAKLRLTHVHTKVTKATQATLGLFETSPSSCMLSGEM